LVFFGNDQSIEHTGITRPTPYKAYRIHRHGRCLVLHGIPHKHIAYCISRLVHLWNNQLPAPHAGPPESVSLSTCSTKTTPHRLRGSSLTGMIDLARCLLLYVHNCVAECCFVMFAHTLGDVYVLDHQG
jgi:hypothetical protein